MNGQLFNVFTVRRKWNAPINQRTVSVNSNPITQRVLLHFAWVVDDAKCTVVRRVCLSVWPHYCTDPDVTWGVVGDAPSCAQVCGFAIVARVALLWQHNMNAKCQRVYMLVLAVCLFIFRFTTFQRWWNYACYLVIRYKTRMWANAQRDGRPAEHRLRPLFNAAKFGWRSLLHRESKKGCHPNHGYNFVNSWSICKILSLLQRAVNRIRLPITP